MCLIEKSVWLRKTPYIWRKNAENKGFFTKKYCRYAFYTIYISSPEG